MESKQIAINQDKYLIQEETYPGFISKRGYGNIYKAKKENTEECFYIKQISKKSISDTIINQEISNTQIATKLNHPNLLPALAISEDQANYYIVSPYYNKGNLEQFIEEGHIYEESTAIEYFRQICAGLQALHQNKIYVKGIRNEDILIQEKDGKISFILSDYGLGMYVADMHDQTKDNLIPAFSTKAPELLQNVNTPQSDIYSLGCIFYNMLTGKKFRHEHDITDIQKSCKSLIVEYKYPLSELTLNILEACLQHSPDIRITANELSKVMNLDALYTNYSPLFLGSKCIVTIINVQKLEKIKSADILKLVNFQKLFAEESCKLERSLANQLNMVQMKDISKDNYIPYQTKADIKMTDSSIFTSQDLNYQSLKYLYESLRERQDKLEASFNERFTNQKIENSQLTEQLASLKISVKSNSDVSIKSQIGAIPSMQSPINSEGNEYNDFLNAYMRENKILTDLVNLQAKQINDIKAEVAIKINDLTKQLSIVKEASNSEQLIKLKTSIESLMNEGSLKEILTVQTEFNKIHDIEAIVEKSNEEIKSINMMADKCRTEIVEVKKLLGKHDLDIIEIKAPQTEINKKDTKNAGINGASSIADTNQHQITAINDALDKQNKDIREIADTVCSHDKYLIELKKVNTTSQISKDTEKTLSDQVEQIDLKYSNSIKAIIEAIEALNKEINTIKRTIQKYECSTNEISKLPSQIAGQFEKQANDSMHPANAVGTKENNEIEKEDEQRIEVTDENKDAKEKGNSEIS